MLSEIGSPGSCLNAVRSRFSRDLSDQAVLVVGKCVGDSIRLMFQCKAAVRVVTVIAIIKFTPQ